MDITPGASSAQNIKSFLAPNAPTITSVEDVGTNRPYDNGAVLIYFDVAPDGVEAVFFNAALEDGTLIGGSQSSSPMTIENLATGGTYKFKMVAVADGKASEWSNVSSSVTVTTVPQKPNSVTATDVGTNRAYDNSAATVVISPPSYNGGKSVTSYTITTEGIPYGGDFTVTSNSTTKVVTGLTTQPLIRFYVKAVNANGTSSDGTRSSYITTTSTPGGPAITPTLNEAAGSLSVAYDFYGYTGGKAITSTTTILMGEPANRTSHAASPVVFTDLIPGTTYSVNVFGTNANGPGTYGYSGGIAFIGTTTTTTLSPFNNYSSLCTSADLIDPLSDCLNIGDCSAATGSGAACTIYPAGFHTCTSADLIDPASACLNTGDCVDSTASGATCTTPPTFGPWFVTTDTTPPTFGPWFVTDTTPPTFGPWFVTTTTTTPPTFGPWFVPPYFPYFPHFPPYFPAFGPYFAPPTFAPAPPYFPTFARPA